MAIQELVRPYLEPVAPAAAAVAPKISVVIPAVNEADNLPFVFRSLPLDLHEVVLVDGNSIDQTVEVARRIRPDIRILSQSGKGKGNALAAGFAACSGDIVIMLDADGSADPNEIPRFVGVLTQGYDFAKGSRFLNGGGSADITKLRGLGNWALTKLVNLLFRTKYTDLCYGFNAFWRSKLAEIDISHAGFEVETLIHVRVARAGLLVAEVPSIEGPRMFGTSNLNAWRDGKLVLRTILTERLRSGR